MTTLYNANYIETMPFSDTDAQFHAVANVELTYTVPGDTNASTQYQAYFEYASNSNVFVCLNGTPVIPASGTVGTQQYNEFKPEKRYVKVGDVIHFITPDAVAYFGVSLRKIQG